MIELLASPVTDPHCHRSSDDVIRFDVGGHRWQVRWGRYDAFGTPAYWVTQTARGGYDPAADAPVDRDLLSEIVFCILGGFGVTAEAATDAHSAVMPLVADDVDSDRIEFVLRQPSPRTGRRYRFPKQRAERIATALRRFRSDPPGGDAQALHRWLLDLPGVGPKTAAWVVRNHMGSDSVAIIDIWLIRALTGNGVFRRHWDVRRDYGLYEAAFLSFAAQGQVRPSALDLCIWEQARAAGPTLFGAA